MQLNTLFDKVKKETDSNPLLSIYRCEEKRGLYYYYFAM